MNKEGEETARERLLARSGMPDHANLRCFFIQLGGDGTVGSRTELDNVSVNTQRKESLPPAWPPVTGNGSEGARADGARSVLYGD